MTPADHIADCWRAGRSISETIECVYRRTGTLPAFEQVRREFVALAQPFASPARIR